MAAATALKFANLFKNGKGFDMIFEKVMICVFIIKFLNYGDLFPVLIILICLLNLGMF